MTRCDPRTGPLEVRQRWMRMRQRGDRPTRGRPRVRVVTKEPGSGPLSSTLNFAEGRFHITSRFREDQDL